MFFNKVNRTKLLDISKKSLVMLPLCLAIHQVNASELGKEVSFDIKPQALDTALLKFSDQAKIQIIVAAGSLDGYEAEGVYGSIPADLALMTLLKDTGLKYKTHGNTVTVVRDTNDSIESDNKKLDGKSDRVIEEMIVTATKRAESIQDIPVSITAIDAQEMERRSLVNAGDYLISVPGVSYTDRGVGFNQIVIRGVGASTLGTGDSSVGSYLGEAPLVNVGGDWSNPEVILVDMERVEVLKGPQGTLFGSGALGGVVRNIPVAPNLQNIEGEINASVSQTGKYGSDNHQLSAVVNIPIIENVLAIRTVVFDHANSGYVKWIGADDPDKTAAAASYGLGIRNISNVGSNTYKGIRASLLWQVSDNLDVTLTHLNQNLMQDKWYVEVGVETEYESYLSEYTNTDELKDILLDKLDLTNLVVDYDLDWANLVSSSTIFERNVGGQVAALYLYFQNAPLREIADQNVSEGFAQEIRLTSELDGPLQFMVGAYYEDLERVRDSAVEWGIDPALMPDSLGTDDPNGIWNSYDAITIKQKALFGELSYDLSEQFELSYGLRWFDYDRTTHQITSGIWIGDDMINESTSESDVIHRVNINYTPNDDVLLYAQWSQGFRLGRPQRSVQAGLCDTDNDGFIDGTSGSIDQGDVSSDFTDSYELGTKFSLLDGRLRVSAALYRSEWDDIPVALGNGTWGCNITINAGKALTQGAEVESVYYVTNGLQLSLAASWNNSELAEDNEAVGQPKGTRLPNSAKVNGRFGIQQEFELAGREAFIRADYSYLSGFRSNFDPTSLIGGDYGTLAMSAGVQLDDLSISIFGKNLTDESAFSQAFNTDFRGYRIRPRTIGIEAKYSF